MVSLSANFYYTNTYVKHKSYDHSMQFFAKAKISKENAIVIKSLCISKNWGVCKIIKFYYDKQWNFKSVYRLIHKVDASGMTERKKSSGRPWSAHSARNIHLLSELISSQKDQPKTHKKSPRDRKVWYIMQHCSANHQRRHWSTGSKTCFSNIIV